MVGLVLSWELLSSVCLSVLDILMASLRGEQPPYLSTSTRYHGRLSPIPMTMVAYGTSSPHNPIVDLQSAWVPSYY